MAYSELLYTGDGVTTDYSVTFEYLDQSHVSVAVDKVLTTSVGSDYTFDFINSSTVRVRTVGDQNPVPAGLEVRIFRQTPIDNPAVVFGGGASLSSANLNKNSEYLTFALQEATDDNNAFTQRYLGSFSVAPTTDNSGGTLIVGAMYFDIDEDALYFWNGTEWKKGDLLEASQAARDAAQASANAAATSETNAATSATNASDSETNAASSASAASTSETNAASSASAASTSETNAASSASAASTSETNAASSASAASTSETNAATSETNAAGSASAASTSETNAASSASAAAASFDSFDDRYLGEKTSDPATDNDGDPLVTGAIYFNSSTGRLKVYDGAAWQTALVPSTGFVSQTATTGSAELPVGTTAQRDGSPAAGYVRFNTENGNFEGFDGSAWGAIEFSSAYATAAQGSKADTSIQPGDTQTTADWETGTGTTESLVSPAKVKAAVLANASSGWEYTSAQTTISGGTTTTFTHGLGREPEEISFDMICTTAVHGYNVGDKIRDAMLAIDPLSGRGLTVYTRSGNTTQIVVATGNSLRARSANGATEVAIDFTNFDIIVKAR